ncbi:MAG: hypothetical protein GX039_00250, partial [Clostridia bacterium]|nr:hypothetical protein [Clostridia bacterium]
NSSGQPHILLQDPAGKQTIHMYLTGSHWQQLSLPFRLAINPLLLQPLTQDRMLLSGYSLNEKGQQLFWTVYSPANGWHASRFINGHFPLQDTYIYWCNELLYLLYWYKQDREARLFLKAINLSKGACRSLIPGISTGLPDARPALLARERVIIFLWTSSDLLHFCFSQDGGQFWSRPQSSFFFFPTRVKAVEGFPPYPAACLAFTKLCGLEPDWPLVVDIEPLAALCKAFLQKQDGNFI